MKRIALVVFALTLTACSGITVQITMQPTATVTLLPPTPTVTLAPTLQPKPTDIPIPNIIVLIGFSPAATNLINESIAQLWDCSPPLYAYLRQQVTGARRHVRNRAYPPGFSSPTGTIMINEKSLLAPDEDIQPVLVMGLFIHEARHIDQYYRRVEFPTVEAKERDANLYFPRLLRDCGGSIPLDRYYDGTQYWDWEDP